MRNQLRPLLTAGSQGYFVLEIYHLHTQRGFSWAALLYFRLLDHAFVHNHLFITSNLFVLTFFYAITNSRQYLPSGIFLKLLANNFPLRRHQAVFHFLTCKIILLNLSLPNLNNFGARWLP